MKTDLKTLAVGRFKLVRERSESRSIVYSLDYPAVANVSPAFTGTLLARQKRVEGGGRILSIYAFLDPGPWDALAPKHAVLNRSGEELHDGGTYQDLVINQAAHRLMEVFGINSAMMCVNEITSLHDDYVTYREDYSR